MVANEEFAAVKDNEYNEGRRGCYIGTLGAYPEIPLNSK